jgi:Na+-transporting NADH:ubiquinone oxidoreductase subunit C
MFTRFIKPIHVDGTGRLIEETPPPDGQELPLYVFLEDDDVIKAYIVPINSRGLWGRIHGYLAIENDGTTIKGFTVFKHSETPGLGGEIEKDWFQKNWVGKQIVDRDGEFVSVAIAKGAAEEVVSEDKRAHYVDGISGATLTGKYLSAGIKETLQEYEPVSINFRRNQARPPSQ